MKSLIYTSAIIALFFLYSCSDDSSKTPASDLNGTWSGEYISVNDTARYNFTITEAKEKISGIGELYGYRFVRKGTSSESDLSKRTANVNGLFKRPDVQTKFHDSSSFHFSGQLTEDKMSINGQVSIYYKAFDTIIDYPVTLFRK